MCIFIYIIKMGKLKLTEEDKQWALDIRAKFDNKCMICGAGPKWLNAHHILPREIKSLKYDLNNGALLCVKHHMFSREISAHNNPFAFFFWLCDHYPDIFQNARDNYDFLKTQWKK